MNNELLTIGVPSGTFIKTEIGTFYVKNNKRMRVLTKSILSSWRPHRVVEFEERLVAHMPIVGKLPFRDGTLLYRATSGTIYLMSDSKKRQVVGGDTMRLLGLELNDAIIVADDEIDFITEGETIE